MKEQIPAGAAQDARAGTMEVLLRGGEVDGTPVRDHALLARTLRTVGERYAALVPLLAPALADSPEPLLASNRLLDLPPGYLPPPGREPEWCVRFVRIASQSGAWGRATARDPEVALATERDADGSSRAIEELIARVEAGEPADDADLGRLQRSRRRLWYVDVLDAEVSGRRDAIVSAGRITELAERVVDDTLRYLLACEPRLARLRVCILGMGKLGSRELNPSSDIDLIALYDPVEPSDTDAADTALVVRRLTALIEQRDAGAPVFRVDWRLRPFGTQGAPAWRRDHALAYYELHGRPWERLAMLRARPVAGDRAVGENFLKRLKPFVFRRSLDPGALGEIATMKASIDAERRRRDALRDAPGFDVKLGEGGIREVEFLVQALVLVWGGRLAGTMWAPSTAPTLRWLVEQGLMPDGEADALRTAYEWLRRVEHRVQLDEDRQTHEVPRGAAGELLARRLGFADAAAMTTHTDLHRAVVHAAWRRLFGDAGWSGVDAGVAWVAAAVARASAGDTQLPGELERQGFAAPARAAAGLARLTGAGEPLLGPRSPQRSRRVGERLIDLCARSAVPDAALDRVVDIAATARGREVLVRVCEAEPRAAQVLVTLLATSDPLGRLVAREPALLESLLTVASRGAERERDVLRREIEAMYAAPARSGAPASLELRQERLRRFRAVEEARLALALLTGRTDVPGVCRGLSWLAMELVRICGLEALREAGFDEATPVAALGFGKLGGVELGFGGDVDLVFVCGDDVDRVRYARAVRRWIALLQSPLRFGKLYEVDTRLRPDGGAGMVVSGVSALGDYYAERAWGYEKVALWRASPAASFGGCGEHVGERVDDVLRRCDPDAVAANLWEIRDRRVSPSDAARRIKTAPGGLMDLEIGLHLLAIRAWVSGRWSGPRTGNSWEIVPRLLDAGALGPAQADALLGALALFRATECWVRLGDGRGGEELPTGRALRAVEARVLGVTGDGSALVRALEASRATVLELLATIRQ